jgi:hypothetical protein
VSPMLLDRPTATLESLLDSTWSALAHDESAECPICHGEMHPRHSAAGGVAGGQAGVEAARRVLAGRCGDCGTTLE